MHSNNVIDYYVSENLKKNTFFSVKNRRIILKNEFFDQPSEIILRSLSETVKLIGKKSYPVRGKKLDKIILKIKNKSLNKVTIGGCIIEKVNQTLIISKEH